MDKSQNMRVAYRIKQHIWMFHMCVLQGPWSWLNSKQQNRTKLKCRVSSNPWKYVSRAFNEATSFWNILAIYRKRQSERERQRALSKYYIALYDDVFKRDKWVLWVYWPEEQADLCFCVPAGWSPSRQPWSRLLAAQEKGTRHNMESACMLSFYSNSSRRNSGLWDFRTGVAATSPLQMLYMFQ